MPAQSLVLWQTLGLAFLLDMILGDPQRMPHPIRFMGWLIQRLEKPFRRLPASSVVAGGLFALFLVGFILLLTWLLLALAQGIHPYLKSALEVLFLYYCMAPRCLDKAARDVEKPLRQGNVEKARRELSMIVGRETRNLTPMQICRAAIETVAENFVDGVLSPLFWIALGGAPAAMAFKMISTLDSMVGYKNKQYLLFGRVSARLDDAANFIPARLSVPVIALAAWTLGLSPKKSFRTAVLEGNHHKSPNAGYPEAAFAGALEIKLNGPAMYHGIPEDKPFIGSRFGDPTVNHIKMARRLMLMASLLGVAITGWILFIIK
ncbi:MAG: cobalamin biosynthesis protein CobD [Desulfatibacillum sp.]|nr:cobalamin biosynthesis protein CobD [Desulfatibacillum sp.]